MKDTPHDTTDTVSQPTTDETTVKDVTSHRDRCFELAAHDTLVDGMAVYKDYTS